jgi:hypothetical protein
MKALCCGLLSCFGLLTAHAALDPRGIPAESVGLIYVSNEVVDRTVFGQALDAAFKTDVTQSKVVRQLEEKLGIRLDEDLKDLHIGIFPMGPTDPEGEPDVALLIRGHFNPARIEAFARSNKVPVTTAGKYLAWDAAKFIQALTGEAPDQADQKPGVIIAYSPDILIFASKNKADATLAALNGKAASWQAPASLSTKDRLNNQWIFAYVDVLKAAKPADRAEVEESGIQNVTLAVGESTPDLQVRITATFTDPDKAALTLLQVKALPTMIDGALTIAAAGKKPEEIAALEKLQDLIHKIQITGAGSTISAQLNYPAKDAATALIEAAKKSKQGK